MLKETVIKVIGQDAFDKLQKFYSENKIKFEEVKMKEAKLEDGSVIKYDGETPTPGMAVTIATEQGELPIPDGTHKLEDGTEITTEAGVIVDVKAAVKTEEKKEEKKEIPANPNDELVAQMETQKKELELEIAKTLELSAKISENEKEILSLKEAKEISANKIIELENTSKEIFSIIQKIAELPSEEPVQTPKNVFSKIENRQNKLLTISQAISELRNKNKN